MKEQSKQIVVLFLWRENLFSFYFRSFFNEALDSIPKLSEEGYKLVCHTRLLITYF